MSEPEKSAASAPPRYSRVLLKISGEALMGSQTYGIDIETVERVAADVKDAVRAGTQMCLVIGGGNIFRGLAGAAKGIDRDELVPTGASDNFVRLDAIGDRDRPRRLGVNRLVLGRDTAELFHLLATAGDLQSLRLHFKAEFVADLVFQLFNLVAVELDDFLAVLADDMAVMGMIGVIGIVEFVILAEIHFPYQPTFGQQRQGPIDRGARYRFIPLTGPR